MKILIVEDEEILMKVLREKLEKEKFIVDAVSEGDLVFDTVKSFKPDLVLLDVVLPKKDGLQVLEQLKSSIEFPNIPVIMLSNLGDDEKIKEALKLGAADYLVKSQHPMNEVVEKIRNYLI